MLQFKFGKVLFLISAVWLMDLSPIIAQKVPLVHSNIKKEKSGRLYFSYDGQKIYQLEEEPDYTLEKIKGNPRFSFDLFIVMKFSSIIGRY